MLVLVLLARAAADSFFQGVGKLGVATTASSGESAEEDDSGEDDKNFNDPPTGAELTFMLAFQKTIAAFILLDHIQEITVPPPQG